MDDILDNLYAKSSNNITNGLDLYSLIIKKENILLAYRNLKSNTGAKTPGVDGKTIEELKLLTDTELILKVRRRLANYKPHSVKRIEIPKPDGKKRPLGIPTIEDRLIQQMIKQILEPIVEAKFHKHSYGFRPNRSAHHAIARCVQLINTTSAHYVVDIDIKGFFDNVDHNKLIKQLYAIGIRDKRVLCIINKMLKAPIKGIGIPSKGTPQGGILSPLLANVVLNEFDWWISNQWETFKTRYDYKSQGYKHSVLKSTSLKTIWLVRYADDFKLFTNTKSDAKRMYFGVKKYLKKRLDLDISEEKSQITNLKKHYSNFLGFKIKAQKKKKRYVIKSGICDKKKKQIFRELKDQIKKIQKEKDGLPAWRYNQKVMGIQNYFQYATDVNKDLSNIGNKLVVTMHNRLKNRGKYGYPNGLTPLYKSRYKNKMKIYKIDNHEIFPIGDIRMKRALNLNPKICPYSNEGKKFIHNSLKDNIVNELERMHDKTLIDNRGSPVEFYDNRLSKYSLQNGKCYITNEFLKAEQVHCHHIIPKYLGGNDSFNNLIILSKEMHKLIHAVTPQIINKYLLLFQLNSNQIKKINRLREKCNLEKIC